MIEEIKPSSNSTDRFLNRINLLMDKAHNSIILGDINSYREFLEQLNIELVPYMTDEKEEYINNLFLKLNKSINNINKPQAHNDLAKKNYSYNVFNKSKFILRSIHKELNKIAYNDLEFGVKFNKRVKRLS